jgi:hypothetical protein
MTSGNGAVVVSATTGAGAGVAVGADDGALQAMINKIRANEAR